MKVIEIDVTYHQCLMIKIINFDNNNLTNLDSITVITDPSSDNELANKKYVDDTTGDVNVLKFNQTVENYLKVSVGNDTYNPTKYDRIQLTDTTIIKYLNTGGALLQNWIIKCNDKNKIGKIQYFIESAKTNSPTVIQEQRFYLPSVIVLCILRHQLIFMVLMFLSASNEQIIFK